MKVWSQFKNPKYIIDHQRYGPADAVGRRDTLPGLAVEFYPLPGMHAGSLLDTEAQGWDEELRERIETYLMGHRDWGVALRLADDAVAEHASSDAPCRVMIQVEGGVRLCGRPATQGDLCEDHVRLLEPATPLPAAPEQVNA